MPGYGGYQHSGCVLVTQPVQLRSILWCDDYGIKPVQLIFPYGMFAVTYHHYKQNNLYYLTNLKVVWSKEPFTGSLDQNCYGLPLYNTDSAYNTCLYEWPHDPNLEKLVNKSVAFYWATVYSNTNDSFAHWWYGYGNSELFHEKWRTATKQRDFDFIFRQNLHTSPSALTVRQLLTANGKVVLENLKVVHPKKPPTPEEIRALAQAKWEASGKPDGNPDEFWFAAERELRG